MPGFFREWPFLSGFLVILALAGLLVPGCQPHNRRIEREDTMNNSPLNPPPMDENIPDEMERATFALG